MEEREKYRTFLEMSGGVKHYRTLLEGSGGETSSKTLLEGNGGGGTAPGTNWRGMEERPAPELYKKGVEEKEQILDSPERNGGKGTS